jgi:hypothetical protein
LISSFFFNIISIGHRISKNQAIQIMSRGTGKMARWCNVVMVASLSGGFYDAESGPPRKDKAKVKKQ